MIRKSVKPSFTRWASSALVAAAFFSVDVFGACTYTVDSQWQTGFNATVKITNTTSAPVNGWNVQWQYAGNNRVQNVWNGKLSGNNPYAVSNVQWNGAIAAGQSVSFGMQGTKTAGNAEIPILNGALCQVDDPNTVDKVFIQVDQADDHLFVYVDGVRKMQWSLPDSGFAYDGVRAARLGEKIDITHLLGKGKNDIRIVAGADSWDGITGSYQVKLWADNDVVLDAQHSFNYSSGYAGVQLDETVTIDLAKAPERRLFSILSSTGGEAIYINNVFTGKLTPANFELAPGEYRIGVGESTEQADWGKNTAYFTGRYREKDIVISNQNVAFSVEELPVVEAVNEWNVAVVAYTNVHFGLSDAQADAGVSAAANNIGVMTSDDIKVAEEVVKATSDRWLLPMSYGLMKWKVTSLPPVTQKVYRTNRLRNEGTVQADLSGYDMVVHVIANRTLITDSNGVRRTVANDIGGAAGRPDAWLPQSWLNAEGANLTARLQNVLPSTGMLHEALHTYDNYRWNGYNGVNQLHGPEIHGYPVQDCGLPSEWLCWYRSYIRSQIGENWDVLDGSPTNVKITGDAVATYTGIFNLMRGGRGVKQLWSFAKPIASIRNVGSQTCMDVAGGNTADNTPIISWSCGIGDNQLWSFQHVQNGAYQLLSKNSQKCADFSGVSFLQKTCSNALTQRYLLVPATSNRFAIKTLTGQCLAITADGNLATQSCDPAQPRQLWQNN